MTWTMWAKTCTITPFSRCLAHGTLLGDELDKFRGGGGRHGVRVGRFLSWKGFAPTLGNVGEGGL